MTRMIVAGKPFPPSSPLSIPPHFTSRIPKGDPLEERLHDMLRWVEYVDDVDDDDDDVDDDSDLPDPLEERLLDMLR